MADESKNPTPEGEEHVYVAAAAVGDETGVKAAGAIAVEGDAALLIAQFADMDAAKQTYQALRQAESQRRFDIDSVLVVNADAEGKIHVQKMTDHTTRTGFAWGAVAGVVLGVIFPPSILASAATLGAAGAIAGKVGNQLNRGDVAKELADTLPPGSSGLVVLAHLRDVEKVKQEMPAATKVTSVPVSGETADAIKEASQVAEPAGSTSS
jgi:uncharacterized membrane protein